MYLILLGLIVICIERSGLASGLKKFRLVGLTAVVVFALPPAVQATSKPENIVGPNECAECHKDEAKIWKKSHHFTTFRRMPRSKAARKIKKKMKIKRIKSKSLCLNCHFTVRMVKKKPKAASGISCEKCHGDGKDYLKVHAEFSGHKKKEDEPRAKAKQRWRKSIAAGMIRPTALYALAKNCYSCHVVPREKLVNVGKHPAGSKFELVSWSQGEVRHNVWYSNGKKNLKANTNRKRMMYLVGVAVEFETAIRAVGVATKKKTYAIKMARRAAAARKRLIKVAKALPNVPELKKIAALGKRAALKLNNNAALTKAADRISKLTLALIGKYDGSKFGAIDKMIPGEKKYRGRAAS
ncbi:MAG: cytochrome c family protein [Hyphomicrobiales bacterium]|nr:cytochrome c family protein [Hyphomicrobiales bacterium]